MHTPTPWQISDARTTDDTTMVVGGVGFEFGLIADVTEDMDAAFIVKAVNAHDALVGALHRLTNEVRGIFDAFEYGIRQEINNANFAVVCDKLDEACRVLDSIKEHSK